MGNIFRFKMFFLYLSKILISIVSIMKIRIFAPVVIMLLFFIKSTSQTTHEIGAIAGPVALFSDYGVRGDLETNIGNTGIGVGIVHYLKFCYHCGRTSYFNNHFMVRNEVLFHQTDLQHYGKWVSSDRTSLAADQLRAMKGSTSVLEVGSSLEYYFFNIRDYNSNAFKVAPFIGLGVRWVLFSPTASSSMGELNTEETTPKKYFNAFKTDSGTAFSLVANAGFRYKLTERSDLMLETRWHYYTSDWIDGLNPSYENNEMVEVPENRSNDWMFAINAGYIFYLN